MLRLLVLALIVPAVNARMACLMAYADDQCQTMLPTKGLTNVQNIDVCIPIVGGLGGYFQVECFGDTMQLRTFTDAACTIPKTYPGYSNTTLAITGCQTVAADTAFAAAAEAFLNFPVDSVSFRPVCNNQACPAPPPPGTPSSPTPGGWTPGSGGTGKYPGPPGQHSGSSGKGGKGGYSAHGNGGYGYGEHGEEEEEGGIVLLVLLCICLGVAAGSCYWCTCCPWYMYRTTGSISGPEVGGMQQLPEVAVPGFLPSPTSTAPVVVAGVPVDMESAPPYDPQPAHGTYAAAPLEAKDGMA